MNTRVFVFGVVASVMLCASEMSAQSVSPQPSADWQFEFVPYLWGSGMEGEVGIGNRTADVDASFRNILSHLHFAAMGLTEVRRDRMVALTDLIYTDLRGQHATPGPLFSSVNPEQKLFILTFGRRRPACGHGRRVGRCARRHSVLAFAVRTAVRRRRVTRRRHAGQPELG